MARKLSCIVVKNTRLKPPSLIFSSFLNIPMADVIGNSFLQGDNIKLDKSFTESRFFIVKKPSGGVGKQGSVWSAVCTDGLWTRQTLVHPAML